MSQQEPFNGLKFWVSLDIEEVEQRKTDVKPSATARTQQEVEETISSLGGAIVSHHSEASHVVLRHLQQPQAKEIRGQEESISPSIVSVMWIRQCAALKELVNHASQNYYQPMPQPYVQGFQDVSLSFTGFEGAERVRVRYDCECSGARVGGELKFSGKVLLVTNDSSQQSNKKLKAALQKGVPIVSHQWIQDCLKYRAFILPEYPHHLLHKATIPIEIAVLAEVQLVRSDGTQATYVQPLEQRVEDSQTQTEANATQSQQHKLHAHASAIKHHPGSTVNSTHKERTSVPAAATKQTSGSKLQQSNAQDGSQDRRSGLAASSDGAVFHVMPQEIVPQKIVPDPAGNGAANGTSVTSQARVDGAGRGSGLSSGRGTDVGSGQGRQRGSGACDSVGQGGLGDSFLRNIVEITREGEQFAAQYGVESSLMGDGKASGHSLKQGSEHGSFGNQNYERTGKCRSGSVEAKGGVKGSGGVEGGSKVSRTGQGQEQCGVSAQHGSKNVNAGGEQNGVKRDQGTEQQGGGGGSGQRVSGKAERGGSMKGLGRNGNEVAPDQAAPSEGPVSVSKRTAVDVQQNQQSKRQKKSVNAGVNAGVGVNQRVSGRLKQKAQAIVPVSVEPTPPTTLTGVPGADEPCNGNDSINKSCDESQQSDQSKAESSEQCAVGCAVQRRMNRRKDGVVRKLQDRDFMDTHAVKEMKEKQKLGERVEQDGVGAGQTMEEEQVAEQDDKKPMRNVPSKTRQATKKRGCVGNTKVKRRKGGREAMDLADNSNVLQDSVLNAQNKASNKTAQVKKASKDDSTINKGEKTSKQKSVPLQKNQKPNLAQKEKDEQKSNKGPSSGYQQDICVALSGLHRAERAEAVEFLNKLGIQNIQDKSIKQWTPDVTHLITTAATTSEKCLAAMCSGLPIISPNELITDKWVTSHDCSKHIIRIGRNGCVDNDAAYFWWKYKKATNFNAFQSQHVPNGLRVLLCGRDPVSDRKMGWQGIGRLVKAGGGTVQVAQTLDAVQKALANERDMFHIAIVPDSAGSRLLNVIGQCKYELPIGQWQFIRDWIALPTSTLSHGLVTSTDVNESISELVQGRGRVE